MIGHGAGLLRSVAGMKREPARPVALYVANFDRVHAPGRGGTAYNALIASGIFGTTDGTVGKGIQNLLVDFALAGARVRTASRLLVLRKRFGYRDGDALRLARSMAFQDFAVMVGVAPEVVDATLRGLADCGWSPVQGGGPGRWHRSAQGCVSEPWRLDVRCGLRK
ncbi:hypothetical protein X011_13345 [Mycobacterium tuberculosis variant microti OV254]|nr:hypothetical protein X011_13345 [Mycobacterium tuberculosis variant microti OV254]BBX43387.1 hypothetical protein MSIM_48380 [Mycobacterium simiae]